MCNTTHVAQSGIHHLRRPQATRRWLPGVKVRDGCYERQRRFAIANKRFRQCPTEETAVAAGTPLPDSRLIINSITAETSAGTATAKKMLAFDQWCWISTPPSTPKFVNSPS